MRVAVPIWNARVSPVLDTASTLRLYRGADEKAVAGSDVVLPPELAEKARAIAREADVVICGALSGWMERELIARGVTLHPWVMGDVDEVMDRWRCGRIGECEGTMPGCGRHKRGRHGCVRPNDHDKR